MRRTLIVRLGYLFAGGCILGAVVYLEGGRLRPAMDGAAAWWNGPAVEPAARKSGRQNRTQREIERTEKFRDRWHESHPGG
jgi:hypothetical protein